MINKALNGIVSVLADAALCSPWQKAPLHSTGDASRLTALFLGRIWPICSLVTPCQPGASPVSVRRGVSPRAVWTVSPQAVYGKFRKVRQRSDLFALDLEEVDKAIGWLDAKYKGVAFTEGAAAGAVGAPGLIADIPALVTLNLRAIGEYATYYGFDVASPRERLFAMHVLGLASSPSDSAKMPVMAQLARIAADAAKKKAWKEIEKEALAILIRQMAKALGLRLTKAKLAQAVPIMGSAVGGEFNAYYTARTPLYVKKGWEHRRERSWI